MPVPIRFVLGGLSAAAAVTFATSALAGAAIVDGLGGPVLMQSKAIPGVFGAGSPSWDGAALRTVHHDLHDSGITTDGLITLLLIDTDHGLSFAALVDDNTQSGGPKLMSQVGMSSTAPDSGVEFINDNGQDIGLSFDPPNGTQTAAGHFTWNSAKSGDGFSWAELKAGDFVSFNFTRNGPEHNSHPGLDNDPTFQFVSWNGSEWIVLAERRFSQVGDFAFSFTVIPLPAPVALGLVGLGLAGLARRRMSRPA